MVFQHMFSGIQTTRTQVGFLVCLALCFLALYAFNTQSSFNTGVLNSHSESHLRSGDNTALTEPSNIARIHNKKDQDTDSDKLLTVSAEQQVQTTRDTFQDNTNDARELKRQSTEGYNMEVVQHVNKSNKAPSYEQEHENNRRPSLRPSTKNLNGKAEGAEFTYGSTMARRTKHFKDTCDTLKGYHTSAIGRQSLTYLKDYNLGLKFTAKVGTTFLLQMILVLNSSGNISDSIFNKARSNLHKMRFLRTSKYFDQSSIRQTTAVLFARDPISRLYSAFIDKVFLMNNPGLVRDVIRFNRNSDIKSCPVDITFQEFINYALNSPRKILDDHYGPISERLVLPVVCNAEDLVIVKGESFSTDIEYVLNKIRAENNKRKVLHDALHSKRTKTTVVGIIKTMCAKYRLIKNALHCGDWRFLSQRLWESFQIQGYIDFSKKFPSSQIPKVKMNKYCQLTVEVFLKEIRTHPLTSERSVFQRASVLAEAYTGVSDSYIQGIFETYDADFRLFDYNKVVPTLGHK